MKTLRTLILISLIVAIILPMYFVLQGLLTGTQNLLSDFLFTAAYTFVVTFSIGYTNGITINYLRRKLPWHKYKAKRIIVEVILTSFNAGVIITIIILSIHFTWIKLPKEQFWVIIYSNVIIAMIVNLVIVTIWESRYFFDQWKYTLVRTERLKRENIESQFAALKNQINPHFLFNSLNALSSLITSSPEKAREFIAKFSKIYRYVLEIQDEILVELKQELDFMESYYFLQKIRYEDSLNIEIHIESSCLNLFVPPLSIQILVENAIKHNEISADHPLQISINNQVDYLVIKNNYQPREGNSFSTGVGQANLVNRYEHFTDRVPEFYVQNDSYIARIPLIREEE